MCDKDQSIIDICQQIEKMIDFWYKETGKEKLPGFAYLL